MAPACVWMDTASASTKLARCLPLSRLGSERGDADALFDRLCWVRCTAVSRPPSSIPRDFEAFCRADDVSAPVLSVSSCGVDRLNFLRPLVKLLLVRREILRGWGSAGLYDVCRDDVTLLRMRDALGHTPRILYEKLRNDGSRLRIGLDTTSLQREQRRVVRTRHEQANVVTYLRQLLYL